MYFINMYVNSLFLLVFEHIKNSIGVNIKPSYNALVTHADEIEIVIGN